MQDAWGWCMGMTQRDVMGREVGGKFIFGNACTPVVDSCQCMAKPIKLKKKISWLQSPSAVILEPPKIKSDTFSTVSPSICHEVMGPTCHDLRFLNEIIYMKG